MKILVLNSGSSSIKYRVFNIQTEKELAKGLLERVGKNFVGEGILTHVAHPDKTYQKKLDIPSHEKGIKLIIDILLDKKYGIIKKTEEIVAVGHRVVHGKDKYSDSVVVDAKVLKDLHAYIELSPLHEPANIAGIEACMQTIPHAKQVAVFDTAFHHTMPDYAYLYGIPYYLYKEYGIRRYGFHGTSHKYVYNKVVEILSKKHFDPSVITLHLGNGSSIAAIKHGKVIDTSMGFTPLEGLIMGTRCGDIDPAIVTFLMEKLEISAKEVDTLLNKQSGLLGVSNVSSDMRDLLTEAGKGNAMASTVIDMFCYRIVKYIGAYHVALGGVNAIVFTAGIGENNPIIRQKICESLLAIGVRCDKEENTKPIGEYLKISTEESMVDLFVIPTNEELMIAKETKRAVEKKI